MIRRGSNVFRALCCVVMVGVVVGGCDEDERERLERLIEFNHADHEFRAVREYRSITFGRLNSYVELVRSNGRGAYSVDLLELNGFARDAMSDHSDMKLFDDLDGLLDAGHLHRVFFQRDFAVQDVELFLKNYQVQFVGATYSRELAEMLMRFRVLPIASSVPDRPYYDVEVIAGGPAAGFPVSYREVVVDPATLTPRVTASMSVRELEYGEAGGLIEQPDCIVQSRTTLSGLRAAKQSAAAHGLTLVLPDPDFIPPGFELTTIEEIVVLSDVEQEGTQRSYPIFRFGYTDGVDRLELLEHAPAVGGVVGSGYLSAPAASGKLFVPTYQVGSVRGSIIVSEDLQVVVETRLSDERFNEILRNLYQF